MHVTMFCDVNFMYGLYHDCAKTHDRSLAGKLVIVTLSGDIGFAKKSSKPPRTLTSFSRACVLRSACTCDVTCELYCSILPVTFTSIGSFKSSVTIIDSHMLSEKIQ